MKNLLFALALVPAVLTLAGCGGKRTEQAEPEYTVAVEVDEPVRRVSGAMQNPAWADEK